MLLILPFSLAVRDCDHNQIFFQVVTSLVDSTEDFFFSIKIYWFTWVCLEIDNCESNSLGTYGYCQCTDSGSFIWGKFSWLWSQQLVLFHLFCLLFTNFNYMTVGSSSTIFYLHHTFSDHYFVIEVFHFIFILIFNFVCQWMCVSVYSIELYYVLITHFNVLIKIIFPWALGGILISEMYCRFSLFFL